MIHCFTGTQKEATKYIALGFYLISEEYLPCLKDLAETIAYIDLNQLDTRNR
jgi:Tat protein secretion system quality control protein TatD with DNase activity